MIVLGLSDSMTRIIAETTWESYEDLNLSITLYLSYLEHYNKTYGYIFIIEVHNMDIQERSHSWVCIPNTTSPSTLAKQDIDYNDVNSSHEVIKECYHKLFKVIEEQNSDAPKHLKEAMKEEFNDLFTDAFFGLAEELAENYETTNYSGIKGYYHDFIKNYLLNPIDFFNKYSGEGLQSNEEDIEVLKLQISDMVENFNKISDTKTRNKLFNDLMKGIELNPLLQLRYATGSNTKEKPLRLSAVPILQRELGIKKTLLPNKQEQCYIYDEDLTYYVPINKSTIKPYFNNTFGFILDETDYNKILANIPTFEQQYNNLFVFNNIIYDSWNLCDFEKIAGEYQRKDYLTTNLIGNDNNPQMEFKLLTYNTKLTFEDILAGSNWSTMSLTERTLRRILIPKQDPTDLTLFIDFLERLGSCIRGVNEYKTITQYFGDGDNGKSILKLLMELVYNDKVYSFKAKDLEDNFQIMKFIDRMALIIDEIQRNSFNKLKDEIKRMASILTSIEGRPMYSTDKVLLRGYPNLFIMTNELMDIELDEVALFSRLDILTLPNKFVDKELVDKYDNAYELIEGLEHELREDITGLSWLITASLICFEKMKSEGRKYLRHQNIMETMKIYTNTDELLGFLELYTEYDMDLSKDEYVTNKEIASRFKQYIDNEKIPYTAELLNNDTKLYKTIGIKLNKLYKGKKDPKFKEKRQDETFYKLRLRTFEEVEAEYDSVYTINEKATSEAYDFMNSHTELKTVFDYINKGTNTINQLKEVLGMYDVKHIISQLELHGLIVNEETQSLDNY